MESDKGGQGSKAILAFINETPQDYSMSPEFPLYLWAKEEIARQNGIIDKSIVEPPEFHLDGSTVQRDEVIAMLNLVKAEIANLATQKGEK